MDDDEKLTLHGLRQFFIKLERAQKNRKHAEVLDQFWFNQIVIFASEVKREGSLSELFAAA